jgi:hypothetical protein
MRSASNLTLSPTFTCLSIAGIPAAGKIADTGELPVHADHAHGRGIDL